MSSTEATKRQLAEATDADFVQLIEHLKVQDPDFETRRSQPRHPVAYSEAALTQTRKTVT